MQNTASRCLLFGLILGWSLSHAVVFAQPAKTDKLRQGLDKVVTVDFSGQSLADAINHMREKMGLRINIDQVTMMQMGLNPDENVGQVRVKGTNEKAGQILRRLLNAYNLTYIVQDEALLVTTEEMALQRQFRQRVSVDLDDVPFRKAVRDLARTHGINLVIDPKVAAASELKVSLTLDNTDLETTIRLLAEVVELKAVPMGNVIFVTNVTKAKLIREEDRDRMDPLNPGMPRYAMPAPGFRAVGGVIGGFGGGFGGIAMPQRGIAAPPIAIPDIAPAIEAPPAPKSDPKDAVPQRVNPDGATSSPPVQRGTPRIADPPVIRRLPPAAPPAPPR